MLRPGPKSRLRLVVVTGAVLVGLALPGTSAADHVTATFTATAKLGPRATTRLWTVYVEWSIICNGASVPRYAGDASLVDQGSGESIYLGGTAGQSGKSTIFVPIKAAPRTLKPRLNSSCFSATDLHGSRPQEFFGEAVVVPALSCDPDLLAKALREYATARSFYDAVGQDLRNSHEKSTNSLAETARIKAEQAAVKAGLRELIGALGADAALAAEVTVFWVRIGVMIQAIAFKVVPSIQNTRKAFREARADFERAEVWRKRAEADLEAALRQGPCRGPLASQLDQALAQQRNQEAARALIESWENNGYLYLNPATGEALDEAAALREARRALEGGQRSTQSRAAAAARQIKATRSQIEAAVAKLTVAQALNERVRARVRRADAAAERLRTRLRAVLH